MENGSDRQHLRGGADSGRRWRRGQRNSVHKVGPAAQPAGHDVATLGAAAGRTGLNSHRRGASQRGHRGNAGFNLLRLRGHAQCAHSRSRGGPRMTSMSDRIVFEDVSKFYGEVLGVNRVSLSIPPGVTTLVGPNGSGKTTLMNLMTGLVQPSSGHVSVLGLTPGDATRFFREVGY